jgi:hypothetical protein
MPTMTGEADDQQRLVAYLLGSLPDDAAERLDELSVTDAAFADALVVAEHDLIDAYIRGELNGETLERFRSHYLASPFRREKVELARALGVFADSQRAAVVRGQPATPSRTPRPRPSLRWVLAAAASALLVLGSWLALENTRLRNQVREIEARGNATDLQRQLEAQRGAAVERDRELARIREERGRLEKALDAITIASFVLTPQVRGAAQPKDVVIRPGTSHVAIQLALDPGDYSGVHVALLDRSGRQTLWRSEAVQPRRTQDGKVIDVTLRAQQLPPDRYLLRVEALPPSRAGIIGDYAFRVLPE